MARNAPYRKFIHWLDPEAHGQAIGELQRDKKRVHRARHQPCEALYARRERVLVAPEVWDRRCLRQGSWYRASDRRGQYLLVGNAPEDGFPLWGTVTLEPFEPPRLATDGDVVRMLEEAPLAEALPEGWGLFTAWEAQAVRTYLHAAEQDRSLQAVFAYYTANHVNFIRPAFHVAEPGRPVIPYSIQGTTLVCSACVEVFGILGSAYPVKYLAPCPGLKYVRHAPGEYLRVTSEVS